MTWTQQEAIEFCTMLEKVLPDHGWHVALTVGCLYKDLVGRKDVDVILYRIRQHGTEGYKTVAQLLAWMEANLAGLTLSSGPAEECFVNKAFWGSKRIDFLYPEAALDGSSPYPETGTLDFIEMEASV